MNIFFLFAALCFSALLCGTPLLAQNTNQGQVPADAIATGGPAAAQAATDVWLGWLDDGEYVRCWQGTATLFQKNVPQEKWTALATARRTPLGKLLSRKLTSANFSKTLPGAPEGRYVIANYDTSFEHKKSAAETVTSMLDTDGQWKVVGYLVH